MSVSRLSPDEDSEVMRFARPGVVEQLSLQFPASRDHLTPFVLLDHDTGLKGLQQVSQPDGHLLELPPRFKVLVEIRRWLDPIRQRDGRLSAVSAALGELVELRHPEADVILARTARMFYLLEALLLPKLGESGFHQAVPDLFAAAPELFQALERLKVVRIPLPPEPGGSGDPPVRFYTSPLLLLVVAIGESQCEYFRPHRWEIYSAGRAQEEIRSKWPSLPAPLIDFVAYLVHFQSAPGQYARRTGSRQFMVKAKLLAERSGGLYGEQTLLDTLRLLGFLEEARNRVQPGHDPTRTPSPDELPVSAGASRPWDSPNGLMLTREWLDDAARHGPLEAALLGELDGRVGHLFADEADFGRIMDAAGPIPDSTRQRLLQLARMTPATLARLVFSPDGGSKDNATWGYFRFLDLDEPELEKFKDVIRAKAEQDFHQAFAEDRQRVSYSLGRSQVEGRIKVVLAESAKKVANGEAGFEDCFRLELSVVPSSFGDEPPDYTIEVTLRTHLAGEALLFPTGPDVLSGRPRDTTAGALFAHLFEQAKNVFDLSKGALREKQTMYGPYPLVRRMLDVVYRLRPETCASVAISFGKHEQTSVPIPLGLGEPNDSQAIHAVVNYVHAYVLNRAMSRGLQACSLSFDNLIRGAAKPAGGLTGKEWKARIEECRSRNNYELLFETYLPLYNKDGRCVELLADTPPASLKSIPIPQLPTTLGSYLNRSARPRSHALLVGVDVGGTFTKLRVYRLASGRFDAVGMPFRLLTPTGEGSASPGREFATRLVEAIIRHFQCDEALQALKPWDVLAVGISWPGPVRENRVGGYSGILARLGLKGKVQGTTFDDLLKLDVVGHVRAALQERLPCSANSAPYVALINDGNADGTGALVYRTATRPEMAFGGLLVVVKLGTGTAGAVFKDGRLAEGLTEWGKMVLDLLAGWPTDDFPAGLANLHLSAKTLPALIKKLAVGSVLPKVIPDWDSRELGLILEVCKSKCDRASFDGLWEESGLREYASRGGWPAGITVDIFKQVLRQSPSMDPESFRIVQAQLEALGSDATAELQRKVWIHGGIRLQRMLGLSPDVFQELLPRMLGLDPSLLKEFVQNLMGLQPAELRDLLQSVLGLPPETIRARLQEVLRIDLDRNGAAAGARLTVLPLTVCDHLEEAHTTVAEAAKVLGAYLGDFIVLLHDVYNMKTVVATGGVLSDETGRLVRQEATNRVRLYGLSLEVCGTELVVTDCEPSAKARSQDEDAGDPKTTHEQSAANPRDAGEKGAETAAQRRDSVPGSDDFATLGAAVFAAGECLFDLKRQGLNLIKSQVLAMQPGDRLEITPQDQVRFESTSSKEPTDLNEYALTRDDVIGFLEVLGVSLGLYRTSAKRQDSPNFTRWVIQQERRT